VAGRVAVLPEGTAAGGHSGRALDLATTYLFGHSAKRRFENFERRNPYEVVE